jgi:hypothetical protein
MDKGVAAIGAVATAGVIGVMLVTRPAVQDDQVHIRLHCLEVTNAGIAIEPAAGNPAYFTNFGGTNWVVPAESPQAQFTAIVGPVVEVWWAATSRGVYVRRSKDCVNWEEVRVKHVGATSFWARVEGTMGFYRLRYE